MLRILDEFCWLQSTFTLPGALMKEVGLEVPHPGIDKYKPGDQKTYHTYYQWVAFVLLFQAICFYVPHYLWKIVEGGRAQSLVNKLVDSKDGDQKGRIESLIEHYNKEKGHLTGYVTSYIICDIFNFINVILQIVFTNTFLGGEFSSYGLDVLKFVNMNQGDRVDPMVKVFPKLAKCTFHYFGPTGDIMRDDIICILPLNIVNEKIYVFMWFWFVILAALTGLHVLYWVPTLASTHVRTFRMRRWNASARKELQRIVGRIGMGEWMLLNNVCSSLEPVHRRDLLTILNTDKVEKETTSLTTQIQDAGNP
jgi:hypothetical protein